MIHLSGDPNGTQSRTGRVTVPADAVTIDTALVQRVHDSAPVFDACVPPMGFWKDPAREIQSLVDGGFAGVHVTCAQPRHTFTQAVDTIGRLRRLTVEFADQLALCRSVAEIEGARAAGRVGVVVHFQEPKPISDDLNRVETFYELGLRVLQLTYDVQGWLGTGCAEHTDAGLTHLGGQVVDECNRLGILVDVSHCGWQTAWDALRRSADPIAITHTGTHALCPATSRNKPDDLMRAVAESGGMVGICWFSPMLKRAEGSHEVLPASVEDVLDHVEHAVDVVGPGAVGIGSDLSDLHARTLEIPAHSSLRHYRSLRPDVYGTGPPDRLVPWPPELNSHAKARNLTAGLLRRGYSVADVTGIMGGNWLDLLRRVWRG
jgi:membrane dipeptidase